MLPQTKQPAAEGSQLALRLRDPDKAASQRLQRLLILSGIQLQLRHILQGLSGLPQGLALTEAQDELWPARRLFPLAMVTE